MVWRTRPGKVPEHIGFCSQTCQQSWLSTNRSGKGDPDIDRKVFDMAPLETRQQARQGEGLELHQLQPSTFGCIWGFPTMGVAQNGWFRMEKSQK